MSTTHQKTDTQPWYKQFWPWFLIALPGSVVVASLFTVGIAVQNAPIIINNDLGRFVQPVHNEEIKSKNNL